MQARGRGINSILTIRRLSSDASQITDSIMVIDGNTTAPQLLTTIEGPKLYKRNGYYYILAPAGGVTGRLADGACAREHYRPLGI